MSAAAPNIDLDTIHAAQRAWAARTVRERAAVIKRVKKRFAAAGQQVADTVCEETKKSPLDAWFADVVPNLDLFDYWTGPGLGAIRDQRAPLSKLKFPSKRATLRFEPKGVVGLITPWNYPAALPLRNLIPALMAGNAVLFKPSEVTPRTGDLLMELFAAELPPGLMHVVHGASAAGEAVIDASDHVIFIGSVATGRKVNARCADQLKTVSLELGGKDAAIVLPDCDLDRTAAGVFWGAMANSGQNCAAIERAYVHKDIYPRFVAKLATLAKRATVAPVATDAQDATVRAHLDDAIARGATAHGDYPGAVVLTDVPEDAAIMVDETFGPLLPVLSVASADAAVARVNASRFGLTTSIWTADASLADDLAQRLNTGTVTVNNACLTGAMPFAPWSGRGESGTGVTNSHLAIMDMVRPKFVLHDGFRDPEAWWFPASDDAVALAQKTLAWLSASGFDKARKTLAVLSGMKKRTAEQKRWADD